MTERCTKESECSYSPKCSMSLRRSDKGYRVLVFDCKLVNDVKVVRVAHMESGTRLEIK